MPIYIIIDITGKVYGAYQHKVYAIEAMKLLPEKEDVRIIETELFLTKDR